MVETAEPAPSTGMRPQDLVLTMCGAHLRRHGEVVWSGGMVQLLTTFGFSVAAARQALSRLVLRDLFVRTREGRLAFYLLSVRAEALLAAGDRRIFSFARTRPPVEAWTMLWHAIPEECRIERARLAVRLRFLGFGSLQDGTWVAARDREEEVRQVLRDLAIEEHACVMVGRIPRGLPPMALIAQAWRLDAVQASYEQFLSDYEHLREPDARRGIDPEEAFLLRTTLLHRFRKYPALDPELPAPADPLTELRAEVLRTFDDVYAGLEAPASKYFRAVAQAGAPRA